MFFSAAIAIGVAYALVAPAAKADPDVPAPTAGKGKAKPKPPVAPQHKPKSAPAPKETPRSASPDTGGPSKAAKPEPPRTAAAAAHEVVEHESRIEFDERMVRGQSAAGAIFLFQRTPSEFKSIVEVPDSFRPKTVELLQPRRAMP
jgi:outer membrane biosynthesis protein TonB